MMQTSAAVGCRKAKFIMFSITSLLFCLVNYYTSIPEEGEKGNRERKEFCLNIFVLMKVCWQGRLLLLYNNQGNNIW